MPRTDHTDIGAIDLIEEAVHLLRRRPLSLLLPYYAGSLPFFLGLLYFWTDMSRSAYAGEYCAVTSLGIALLFVWMKFCQSRFARGLQTELLSQTASPEPTARAISRLTTQAAVQATGLILLPLAMMITVPAAWVYAFYQNITVLGDADLTVVQSYRDAKAQALLWPGQNHVLLGIFSLFGLFIFINVAALLFLIPYAGKTLLGLDTRFTLNAFSLLNTTFLAVAASLTHLCLDPLIKTVYVLRCHYGASLSSGQDLRILLKRLSSATPALLCLLAAAVIGWTSLASIPSAHAQPDLEIDYPLTATPQQLDSAIREVLTHREFAWRMPLPKEVVEPETRGLFSDFLNWLGEGLKSLFETIGDWWRRFSKWLEDWWPKPDATAPEHQRSLPDITVGLLYLLLTLLACFLGVWAWRLWLRRKKPEPAPAEPAADTEPDLNDENIKADQLPADRWLEMAWTLHGQGEFRTALRALYLGTLARLAENGLIRIARYKSNRDYLQELNRRNHLHTGLSSEFLDHTRIFESVWYGMHAVDASQVNRFADQQKELVTIAATRL